MSVRLDVPLLKTPGQYRRLAREAIRKAESSPLPYFRLSFLSLADGWRALAEEAEKMSDACMHDDLATARSLWPEHRVS